MILISSSNRDCCGNKAALEAALAQYLLLPSIPCQLLYQHQVLKCQGLKMFRRKHNTQIQYGCICNGAKDRWLVGFWNLLSTVAPVTRKYSFRRAFSHINSQQERGRGHPICRKWKLSTCQKPTSHSRIIDWIPSLSPISCPVVGICKIRSVFSSH